MSHRRPVESFGLDEGADLREGGGLPDEMLLELVVRWARRGQHIGEGGLIGVNYVVGKNTIKMMDWRWGWRGHYVGGRGVVDLRSSVGGKIQ